MARWRLPGARGRGERRLKELGDRARAAPANAGRQFRFLRELARQRQAGRVVQRVEDGGFRSNPGVVVEYLKALAATEGLDAYADPRRGQDGAKDLAELLARLRLQADGGVAGPLPLSAAAAATGGAGGGAAAAGPQVVVLPAAEPKRAGSFLRFWRNLFEAFAVAVVLSLLWFVGAVFCRRYYQHVSGQSAGAAASSSTGQAAAQGKEFAPKEYSKDALPEDSVKTFKDVKGCDEAKADLQDIVEYLKHPAKFTRLGGKLPKGVLLTGPPGTGKTLLAKAVAGEAGVPFFYRSGSEFEEMFVGVGARRVRSLFSAAKKKTPCIVFIDEIDAIGGNRKAWGEHHNKKTLNQLLVEMDGFEDSQGIIVIAATNLPETLDKALTRPGRFDRNVVVPVPDVKGRQEILELYLEGKPVGGDVDVDTLARTTVGFSGADLFNLVNSAACHAAKVGLDQIEASAIEFAKDRILMGAERKTMVISEQNKRLTAYHEAGHAVAAMRTRGALPVHKATIIPRGNALGMVSQVPERDQTSVSKQQLIARLDVCMGGKVAEEMIFGKDFTTTGVSEDLRQATSLARYMITECGMSDAVGPVHVKDYRESKHGATLQERVDDEIQRLLTESYGRVIRLLRTNEQDLHNIAQALIERETLTQADMKGILADGGLPVPAAAVSPEEKEAGGGDAAVPAPL